MKNKLMSGLLGLCLVISFPSYSQDSGTPILKVYSNFYKGLSDSDNSTALEVKRVYLGYKGQINENFFAEAKLDIGSPEDQSQFSLIRRYAYFKTAYLKYQKNNLTMKFGLFGMHQFSIQEKNWGYRYISKSFMDEYKYGPSADIGFAVLYRINDYIETDLTISNGEGYKNLQSDNSYKSAFGLNIYPLNNFTVRLYYDFITKEETQSVFSTFIGYKNQNIRIGAEYNKMVNKSFNLNNNQTGVSFYSTYTFNEHWGVFARHDRLSSNILDEEEIPWNIFRDGTSLTGGLEYCPVKNVKCALNYQDWYSLASNGPDEKYIFLNLEFSL